MVISDKQVKGEKRRSDKPCSQPGAHGQHVQAGQKKMNENDLQPF